MARARYLRGDEVLAFARGVALVVRGVEAVRAVHVLPHVRLHAAFRAKKSMTARHVSGCYYYYTLIKECLKRSKCQQGTCITYVLYSSPPNELCGGHVFGRPRQRHVVTKAQRLDVVALGEVESIV